MVISLDKALGTEGGMYSYPYSLLPLDQDQENAPVSFDSNGGDDCRGQTVYHATFVIGCEFLWDQIPHILLHCITGIFPS